MGMHFDIQDASGSKRWEPALFGALPALSHPSSNAHPNMSHPLHLGPVASTVSVAHTIYILMALSLTFATISVISTLFALYWFVNMRRNFRHDLIMLLIQSDFLKSIFFFAFPIVNMLNGPIDSRSTLCQVSGFFLTLGIESSDIAVLLIAVHSAMYILRPRVGLYPYRRYAYALYVLFPALIASLAFLHGDGYVNVGHYCYLRTDKNWARMALSWVPRYVICSIILAIYVFVYAYVRGRMNDFGRKSSETVSHARHSEHKRQDEEQIPPTPPIAYHGLIPSTPASRQGSGTEPRRGSVPEPAVKVGQWSLSSVSTKPEHAASLLFRDKGRCKERMQWNWPGFKSPPLQADNKSAMEEADPLSEPSRCEIASPPPAHTPDTMSQRSCPYPDAMTEVARSQDSATPYIWHKPLSACTQEECGNTSERQSASRSLPNMVIMLRGGPLRRSTEASAQSTPIHLSYSSIDDSGVSKNRDKVRRQLRSLFVYPLVYMIIWVFPFISHVLGYDDLVAPRDPEWLLIVSIMSICIQGAADCIVFSVREQPWKHARVRPVGRWWLSWRLGWWQTNSWGDVGLAGRTREEMLVDGRLARLRRKEEIAMETGVRTSVSLLSRPSPRRMGVREWWDVEPVDGSAHE